MAPPEAGPAAEAVGRQRFVPPDVRMQTTPHMELPDDPRFAAAVEAHGGRITDQGAEVYTTRFQGEAAAGRTATRGGVFAEVVPEGGRGTYGRSADNPNAVGGSQEIPPTKTLYRKPIVLDNEPGSSEGFNQAVERLDIRAARLGTDSEIAAAQARADAARAAWQRAKAENVGAPYGTLSPERLAEIELATATDELTRLRGGDPVKAYQIDAAIGRAQRAGPAGSPARAQALKDLVSRYGGDPSTIDDLLAIRASDASESQWAIKENIVAGNARKQGVDGVFTVKDDHQAAVAALEKQIKAHPDYVAAEAKFQEVEQRYNDLLQQHSDALKETNYQKNAKADAIFEQLTNVQEEGAKANRVVERIHDRLLDELPTPPAPKISEVFDVQQGKNPTPGAPNPKIEAAGAAYDDARAALTKAEKQYALDQRTPNRKDAEANLMLAKANSAKAWREYNRLASSEPAYTGAPGYSLHPDLVRPTADAGSTTAAGMAGVVPVPMRSAGDVKASVAASKGFFDKATPLLSQGLASAVSGGVGAATNQQLNPDDPNAALKGFAAGAIAPYAISRGAGALARRAGRAVPEAEGALATLGVAPGSVAADLGPRKTIHEALPDILAQMNAAHDPKVTPSAGQAPQLPGFETPPGLLQRISDAVAPWANRVQTARIAGMLSDTAGQVQNVTSNVGGALTDLATTPVAAGLDLARVGAARAIGGPVGRRLGTEREVFMSEVPARLRGMRAGAGIGLQAAADVLRTGVRPEEAAKLEQSGHGFGTDIPGLAPTGSRAAGAVDFAFEAPLRALAAADAVFKTSAQGGHLMAEATAEATRLNGGKTPTPAMLTAAARDPEVQQRAADLAKRSVLQEDRGVTDWYKNAMRSAPGPVRAAASIEIPFSKTPYNVVAQGVGLTPAGLAGVVQDMVQHKPARAIEHRVARAALGTAVMVGASADYANGNLTGPRPTDSKEASTLPPGWRPWSRRFVLPDGTAYYLPLAALGPFALPAVTAILAGEAQKQGANALSADWAGKVAMGVGQYAEQNTFFGALANIGSAFSDPSRRLENHAEQIVSQFSPHVVGGGGLGRELQRIMGMPARDPGSMLEALLATTPYTAGMVPPKQDVLGRPTALGLAGPLGALVRASPENDAGVIRAFRRAGTGLPLGPPSSLHDPEQDRDRTLTPAQQQRWQRVFGAALREGWTNAGTPTESDALRRVESDARSAANDTILGRR